MTPVAVLFDFDGVLVDTEPIYDRLTRELLATLGARADDLLFDRLRGLRAEEEWTLIADELGLELPVTVLVERAEAVRERAIVDGRPPPLMIGARKLVRALEGHDVPMAVVSSSPTGRVESVLSRIGLAAAMTVVVGGDVVTRGKPAPDGYLAAAEAIGVEPSRCVVIEDSPRGVDAALAAGAACIHLSPVGGHPRATATIRDLSQLRVERSGALVIDRR